MRTNPVYTLRDTETLEVLVYAPLSKTRLNALVRAYHLAGIEVLVSLPSHYWGQGRKILPLLVGLLRPCNT